MPAFTKGSIPVGGFIIWDTAAVTGSFSFCKAGRYFECSVCPLLAIRTIMLCFTSKRKLDIVDAFMGIYFSAPNPDVDSRSWIGTLECLLELDVEILIEGHGFIHTLRKDIPDISGVIIRRNPKEELQEKLQYLKWLRQQIDAGLSEGLSIGAVEATCFPWGRRQAWEGFINDQLMRFFSLGHWSRAEMVRSFVRPAESDAVLPLVYQARIGSKKP
jgi:hypothetical protein